MPILINCPEFKTPQRAYIACLHVLHGATAEYVEPATDDEPGTILCSACIDTKTPLTKDDFSTICAGCARRLALIPAA